MPGDKDNINQSLQAPVEETQKADKPIAEAVKYSTDYSYF